MVDVAVPSIATASPNAGDKVLGTTGGLVRNFPVGTGNGLAREVDLANAADPAKGAGLIGFTNSGAGAEARTLYEKASERVSILDFCTPAQRADIISNAGLVDVSSAWQAALDASADNYEIDLCGGTHRLDSAVSISGRSRLRIVGNGARVIEGSPSIAALVAFTSCPRLRVDDIHFVGTETYAYFAANSPTSRRRFISITSSDRVRIKDLTGEAKRGHILLNSCTASIVEGSDFVGFFQDASLGAQADANQCTTVEFSGGRHNKAVRCHAENTGSCVLWGGDSEAASASECTGRNLHDNGVYGSSGVRCRALANDFTDVIGTGVKLRGSQNVAFGNSAARVGTGIGITGNGVSADAYGANGYGNIAIANAVGDCGHYGVGDGIGYGIQDDLYGRDTVIAFNTVYNVQASGGYGGLRGTLTQGGVAFGNVITKIASDYGILHGGTATASLKAATVFGNVIADHNGAQQGIRVSFVTESLIAGNVGTDVVNLVQARNTTNSVFIGNVNPNGTTAIGSSAANSNSSNVVVGQRGVSSVDAPTHMATGNWPSANNPTVSSTPSAVGQTTVQSGIGYIATNTASSADWKQITNL